MKIGKTYIKFLTTNKVFSSSLFYYHIIESMVTTVLITGASGFIAQHIVKQLLEQNYTVIGTVRSKTKGESLTKCFQNKNFHYDIVRDIAAKDALKDLLLKHPEATIFLHTASPFTFQVKDPEKDLLLPAVNGTRSSLEAVKKYAPQIKQVVITSSYAAMASGRDEMNPKLTITETSWNNIPWEVAKKNSVFGYFGSKKFAEDTAWDFYWRERPNFTLNIVNPSYVFGPQAFDLEVIGKDSLNTSSEIINALIKLRPEDEVPSLYFGSFIDVRDVAKAHILAFERDDIHEQRLLLVNGRFVGQNIVDIANKHFPNTLRGNIPTGEPGSGEEIIKTLAKNNNEETRRILGFEFIPLEKTVVDSIDQIVKARHTKL